ncbi:heptaprenylglyceryl phosphate synthase [Sporosarcina trichiuri]|uniref:heptaprenylglyceryl phosphate synthase n=1 Tax=Sporosarcina trichiuri TaxID=3056445 RepID=UPI0025B4B4D9|nr:heptaprenylglyceryl phosphate synthase [Sporosarcina sp. 0.2-SM1T-5]WJY27402.1 heptaprenylglyceryl phosphate synthase [Sporosarcina sp. 0.2-SM1T-5]
MDYHNWRHAFKLDPAKTIHDDELEKLAESGTDGIIVGGTDGITLEGVLHLLARLRRYAVPLALEVSDADAVTFGYDYYFIPTVLNANDVKWMNGVHLEALKEFGHMMKWEEVAAEGYCILNPDCKAAQLTGATQPLTKEDVTAYARMAEHLFRFPIFYMEYSGMYGDPQMVSAAASVLEETKLVYGGGITSAGQAAEMAAIADTVVVGNVIYDDLKTALATVDAVKSVAAPK